MRLKAAHKQERVPQNLNHGGTGGRVDKTRPELTLLSVNGPEAVVTHFVHKTIEEDLRTALVNTKLPSGSVVIMFLDVPALLRATANTNHPQELVDIWKKNTLVSDICAHISRSSFLHEDALYKGITPFGSLLQFQFAHHLRRLLTVTLRRAPEVSRRRKKANSY